jgi:hypothetical protein
MNVPQIPTPEMVAAGWAIVHDQKCAVGLRKLGKGLALVDIYQAMINAAPIEEGASK